MDAEAAWKDALALQREVLARKNTAAAAGKANLLHQVRGAAGRGSGGWRGRAPGGPA